MKNSSRLLCSVMCWGSLSVTLCLYSLLAFRFCTRSLGAPIFDSVSVNPFIIYLIGIFSGVYISTVIFLPSRNKIFLWGVGIICLLNGIYIVCHFANIFHYIDPVYRW